MSTQTLEATPGLAEDRSGAGGKTATPQREI